MCICRLYYFNMSVQQVDREERPDVDKVKLLLDVIEVCGESIISVVRPLKIGKFPS